MSDTAAKIIEETLRWSNGQDGLEDWSAETADILAALTVAGYAVVELPTIAFKGPYDTDASMLRTAADNAELARYPVGGSNVGAAVAGILRVVADATEARNE